MLGRRDFTYEEWSCLLHLYRHEKADVPNDRVRRFKEAGVTEANGASLSPAGKQLVERELLLERRNRLQR
ncbi:hypothetical protein B5K06_23920 [Rhizobium grahamii]|uniref:Uncharacterized protein n=2 Tax=Rhizobium grahamii TaxID=1120045 RepID=S3H961_9HYPH|nr:hypothetical protein RGCCGE502_29493 [Rhizobium grahamii CCGE 502]RDJ05525.1 hypothetical protein B5K06_23920 [Rhizobium grahamii]